MTIPSQRHMLVALGSNLPYHTTDSEGILQQSLDVLAMRGFRAAAVSRLWRTPCFPPGAGPDYVNAAARLETDMDPGAILDTLHAIEAEFGRERIQRWGSRVLDLDLLAVGDLILPDRATWESWRALPADEQRLKTPDRLILPHPRMHERGFVLVPLAEVAPDWRHPVLGQTVRAMLDALPPSALEGIVPAR